MADAAAEAKLRFLHASGHLYAATAPATSAQLMLQRQVELAGNARPRSKDESSSSCRACGTVLIPGWTSQTSRVAKAASKANSLKAGSKKHTRRKISPLPEKYVRVKCLACHRFEDTLLQESKTNSNSEKIKATSQATSSDAMPKLDPESSTLDKTSKASKRRERARKNKSGLQAILDKSKAPAPASSGFGLDLLDLMKQG
ncbi:hypothetical protein IMSHALPRED_003710 [Imshaugia aleurites]|uniref:Uncharacterized protein n=1 Tax=Imshaugia aleurites TaxID=172621 RepID=A0A8H3IGC9_9LECA|nr:hypothetical protein IMSHALPRED_003710 [Imshaugia aleurites]